MHINFKMIALLNNIQKTKFCVKNHGVLGNEEKNLCFSYFLLFKGVSLYIFWAAHVCITSSHHWYYCLY